MMKKVMLVDDVFTANFIMKKMIQKVSPDYQIIDYTFPQVAIDNVAEINPDLIFLDLNMPDLNGWRFLDLMKEKNFENKVYILSSSNSQFDIDQSKQYKNVIGFLLKPLRLNTLSDLLKVIN